MENITQVGQLVAGILVLSWGIKRAGLRAKYVPLLAIVLGLVGGIVLGGANWLSVASGVLLGLATTLGYRVVKESFE